MVYAVDGLVVEGVVNRILRVGHGHECGHLIRHEACRGHHRVLVRTGLRKGLAAAVELRGGSLAARDHDTLVQGVCGGLCDFRADCLMAIRGWHLHIGAAAIGHLGDGNRRAFHAVGAKRGVHVRHGERRCLHGTDGHWRLERIRRIDVGGVCGRVMVTHLLGGVRDGTQADRRGHRGLRGVVGFDQTLQRGFR